MNVAQSQESHFFYLLLLYLLTFYFYFHQQDVDATRPMPVLGGKVGVKISTTFKETTERSTTCRNRMHTLPNTQQNIEQKNYNPMRRSQRRLWIIRYGKQKWSSIDKTPGLRRHKPFTISETWDPLLGQNSSFSALCLRKFTLALQTQKTFGELACGH